ncbi:MAG: ABC transporter permease [Anaerolineae bacterium]|nr:ABC transporter permease [Anaerolineae bacterium]
MAGLLFAPALAPNDAWRTSAAEALQPPSPTHLMGTDALGRDVWSRLLVGGQQTLLQALAAATLASVLGVAAGATSALGRRWVAIPVRALFTALLAVPPIVWSLAILTLLGSGRGPLIFAVAVPLIALMAAMSRIVILSVNTRPYVTAAYAVGATSLRVVINTILPNSVNTIGRYSAILFAYAIVNATALAFLGFSAPGEPEWGVMLVDSRLSLRASPWPALASGLAITALVGVAMALSRGRDNVNG